MVDELIHGQEQEVGILHVGDGAQAGHRRADRDAGQPQLGDRGVEDALVAELVRQAERHSERAAEAAGDADVLADAEDERVAAHLLANAFADRLGDGHLGHGAVPQNTSSSASSGAGDGLLSAKATASSIAATTSASICASDSSVARPASFICAARRVIGSAFAHSASSSLER